MRSKPFFMAAVVAGLALTALPARADRDSAGAGIIIGGAIGAVVGGPPGWVAGMAIGAMIGEGEDHRQARVYGAPVYADAPRYAVPPVAYAPARPVALPPPGFTGVPPDYRAQYAPPVYAAPRVVYPAPAYYGPYGPPRRYYRPYYY